MKRLKVIYFLVIFLITSVTIYSCSDKKDKKEDTRTEFKFQFPMVGDYYYNQHFGPNSIGKTLTMSKATFGGEEYDLQLSVFWRDSEGFLKSVLCLIGTTGADGIWRSNVEIRPLRFKDFHQEFQVKYLPLDKNSQIYQLNTLYCKTNLDYSVVKKKYDSSYTNEQMLRDLKTISDTDSQVFYTSSDGNMLIQVWLEADGKNRNNAKISSIVYCYINDWIDEKTSSIETTKSLISHTINKKQGF
jgi:hypothetical protein